MRPSQAKPERTTLNSCTAVTLSGPIPKHVTLDLCAAPESRSGGLFKHFALISHQEHLVDIGLHDEQCRDHVKAERIDQALTEIEQKTKKTEAARLRKQEQRACKKSRVHHFIYLFLM
jgi:hypothetical protein